MKEEGETKKTEKEDEKKIISKKANEHDDAFLPKSLRVFAICAVLFAVGFGSRTLLSAKGTTEDRLTNFPSDDAYAIFRTSAENAATSTEELERSACPKVKKDRPVGFDVARKRKPFLFEAQGCVDWWSKIERHDVRGLSDAHLGRTRLLEARVSEKNSRFQLRNHPNRTMKFRSEFAKKAIPIDGNASRTYALVNTTLDTFFELPTRWKDRRKSKERFFAQCSNSIEGSQIEAEVTAVGQTVLEFALDETSKASRFGLKQTDIGTKTVIWLNTAGSESGIHFDRTHNFIVQLGGHKRWTLYPPHQWVDLSMFPYMHENYDTSSLSLPSEELVSVSVDTFAGDVLYIPPFWSTGVKSVRDSAHLSINSPSLEQMMWAKAYWRLAQGPFHREWTVPQRVAVFWSLLDALVRALDIVPTSSTAKDFLSVGLKGGRYAEILRGRTRTRSTSGSPETLEVEAPETFVCAPEDFRVSDNLKEEHVVLAAEIAMDLAEIRKDVVQMNVLDLSEELIMEALKTSDTQTLIDFVGICL